MAAEVGAATGRIPGRTTQRERFFRRDSRDVSDLYTPREMVKIPQEKVIGQDHAKKILSVAVYNHYKRIGAMRMMRRASGGGGEREFKGGGDSDDDDDFVVDDSRRRRRRRRRRAILNNTEVVLEETEEEDRIRRRSKDGDERVREHATVRASGVGEDFSERSARE